MMSQTINNRQFARLPRPSLHRRIHSTHPTTATAATEHARYLNEVAALPHSKNLDALIHVLQAQGQSIVPPTQRANLHPLLIPLSSSSSSTRWPNNVRKPSSSTEQQQPALTCLLRWPESYKHMELPVVQMIPGEGSVTLIARSINEYIHRALVEEEHHNNNNNNTTNNNNIVSEAAGGIGLDLYPTGDYTNSKSPSLNAYLTKQVGMFPDVVEALTAVHLGKGDTMSALITGEWYMKGSHFPNWGRPYEFASQLMDKVGRGEEARDVARIALRMPWWTLRDGYQGVRDVGRMVNGSSSSSSNSSNSSNNGGGCDDVRRMLANQDEMSNGGMLPGLKTNVKTKKQEALEEADWLLNKAAAGEVGWDDDGFRDGLAGWYKEAGLREVAEFVLA